MRSSLTSVVVATVPLASGKVIVLSAVGSVTASVVSKASAVAPSKITEPVKAIFPSTSSVSAGVAVPIPTRWFVESTFNVVEDPAAPSTFRSPSNARPVEVSYCRFTLPAGLLEPSL
jgi:hypothetical protein